jgi:hypothetical protein
MRHRSPFLRDEGEGGGGGNQQGGDNKGGGGQQGGSEFRPISSQEEFDRMVLDRVERAKREGFTAAETKYKPGHDRQQELENELASQAEKDKKAAVDAERAKYVPRVVRAEFRAAGREAGLTKEQLDALLEDLDFSKYADDEGEPLADKIEKKVKAFAPGNGKDGGSGNGKPPNFGQGSGHQQSTAKAGEAGLAEAKRRFPERFKD